MDSFVKFLPCGGSLTVSSEETRTTLVSDFTTFLELHTLPTKLFCLCSLQIDNRCITINNISHFICIFTEFWVTYVKIERGQNEDIYVMQSDLQQNAI